jgi:hypothetical protein
MLCACLSARFGPAVLNWTFPPDEPLPPPFSGMEDDVQYFPPGPEFKLSREAAAQKAYQRDLEEARARQTALSPEAPTARE